MLLESKVKDDDNNNKRCKNTRICLLLIFSLLNLLLKNLENFIYDIFMEMSLNKIFT